MDKKFLVERQGRSFVLYAGLLDMATAEGLKSIRTDLVQIPDESNNRVAICTATVVMEKAGKERVFTGIGDAAPNNVAPAMQTCLVRMAETRSKARALRDAVNVGVTAFEELGAEEAVSGRPLPVPTGQKVAGGNNTISASETPQKPSEGHAEGSWTPDKAADEAQKRFEAEAKGVGIDPEALDDAKYWAWVKNLLGESKLPTPLTHEHWGRMAGGLMFFAHAYRTCGLPGTPDIATTLKFAKSNKINEKATSIYHLSVSDWNRMANLILERHEDEKAAGVKK